MIALAEYIEWSESVMWIGIAWAIAATVIAMLVSR